MGWAKVTESRLHVAPPHASPGSSTYSLELICPTLTHSQRWMRGDAGYCVGDGQQGLFWRFLLSWYASREAEGSKDARAAASRPRLVMGRRVFMTAGLQEPGHLADDDSAADRAKLGRSGATVGVWLTPGSLTRLSSKASRSTCPIGDMAAGRRNARGIRPSRILASWQPAARSVPASQSASLSP